MQTPAVPSNPCRPLLSRPIHADPCCPAPSMQTPAVPSHPCRLCRPVGSMPWPYSPVPPKQLLLSHPCRPNRPSPSSKPKHPIPSLPCSTPSRSVAEHPIAPLPIPSDPYPTRSCTVAEHPISPFPSPPSPILLYIFYLVGCHLIPPARLIIQLFSRRLC
jgi:hypothetical protein